jgi:hypothetical protein
VSGFELGRVVKKRRTARVSRRTPSVRASSRIPRLAPTVSAQNATPAESTSKITESPCAGSQVATARGTTGPAPSSGQGRWSITVSTATVQLAEG